MLDTLSDDLLVLIAGHLDLRSYVRLSSTCTTLRRVSRDSRAVYHVTITPRSAERGIESWLALAHVAPRIVSLHARRSVFSHVMSAWLVGMPNLTAVSASFCRVPAPALRAMPPGVQRIRLHCLDPGVGENGAFFDAPLSLSRFPDLSVVDITFASGWTHVQLGDSKTPKLVEMRIRNAPRVLIASALPATMRSVSISARSIIVGRNGQIPDGCETLTIHVQGPTSSLEELIPRDVSALRRLEVSCQRRVDIPRLCDMTSLESLHIRFDAILLDIQAFERLVRLRSLFMESRHCFAVGETTPAGVEALSRVADVRATARGRAFNVVRFLKGRYGVL